MRFLTGLLFGTALTLLAATAVDAPTHALLDRASSQAESLWDDLLKSTSTALFNQPDTSDPLSVPHASETAANTHVLQPAELTAHPAGSEPEPEAESSFAVLTEEEQATALASSPFDLPLISARTSASTLTPAVALAPVPAQVPTPAPGRIRASTTASPLVTTEANDAVAAAAQGAPSVAPSLATATSVWVPFHSERSARGFARRLTTEVEHPFAVERKGPGAYQVVYEAASVDDIAGLEARIAEVTGR